LIPTLHNALNVKFRALWRGWFTQAQIGERIGWSREAVKDHVSLLKKIGADILDFAMQHQIGRAPENGAIAPAFNFTEGLLRNILPLGPDHQHELVSDLVNGLQDAGGDCGGGWGAKGNSKGLGEGFWRKISE
jgi:biotin operon repressor